MNKETASEILQKEMREVAAWFAARRAENARREDRARKFYADARRWEEPLQPLAGKKP